MEDRVHAEILALYGWASAEISELKGRQWGTVKSVLVAFGAIALVAEKVPFWVAVVLLSIASATAILAWRLILRFDEAMEIRRLRQRQVREHTFSAEFMRAWHPGGEEGKAADRGKDESTAIFAAALIAGWLLLAVYVVAATWR